MQVLIAGMCVILCMRFIESLYCQSSLALFEVAPKFDYVTAHPINMSDVVVEFLHGNSLNFCREEKTGVYLRFD